MKMYDTIDSLIGKTPLLKLNNWANLYSLQANIIAKLEYFNPAGSIKDRIAKSMLDKAEKQKLIKRNETVIIEPTSGNTGIGLAMLCASRGYKLIIVMPETMSVERRLLLKAYGAEIILTDGKRGMNGAIEKANELKNKYKNSFIPSQFENLANPAAHFETTGPEIWEDCDGKLDIFIAGVGTGGTISGVGKYLKAKNPKIKIIAVEPDSSPVLSQGISGAHKIQGIGAGFIPKILDTKIYDEVMTVSDDDALVTCKNIAKIEGLMVGISSAANLFVASKIAGRLENKSKTIVTIFPDTGERYLSTGVFSE